MARRWIVFLCTLAYLGCLRGEIHHFCHFEEMLPYLARATPTTLVVFDVSNVLVAKKDRVLRPSNYLIRLRFLTRMMIQGASLQEVMRLIALVEEQAAVEWVDESIPRCLERLRETTPYLMGVTACRPGPFGAISELESHRAQRFSALGLDFGDLHLLWPSAFLSPLSHYSYTPRFVYGILFCGEYSKGLALSTLLKKVGFKPDRVIAVDDKVQHLHALAKEFGSMGIPFLGLHFEAASLYGQEGVDLDVVALQYRCLLEEEIWLSDEEAKERLSSHQGSI